jgi:predicted nuclease of predicted toxin-antitoxin system
MIIVVDENMPRTTVEALRADGHTVTDIRGTPNQGANDEYVWTTAQRLRAVLISTDKGFTTHRSEAHYCLLVIRLRQPTLAKIHARVMMAVRQQDPDSWRNLTLVVRDAVQSVFRYVPSA